jgi:diguanylate cyclase (GGDEF)-like protein
VCIELVSRKKIYVKASFFAMVFFIIALLVVTIPVYKAAGNEVKKQLGNKCKGIAVTVAALIEEDIENYVDFIKTLDRDSEYYKKMKTVLGKIKFGHKENIEFLDTEIRVSDAEIMYVLDADADNTADFAPPGLRDPITSTRLLAYDTKGVVKGDFLTTQWGTLLSAYAPIYNKKTGEFVGLVGTDVSINYYDGIMNYQLMIILLSTTILILMIITVLLVSTGALEKMLIMDSLTNTFNRRFFEGELKERIKISEKTSVCLFVFMADLDNFKNINDTYGHSFGDKVLTFVSKTMLSVLRDTDCLARYGGEEFVVCLSGIDAAKAVNIANRMREAVAATPIYDSEQNESVSVSVSIGVVQYMAGQNQNQERLLKNADKALYEAKTTKNAVVLFKEN